MIEITEELLKEDVCSGIRIVLTGREIPLKPDTKLHLGVLLETTYFSLPVSNRAFCLDIYLDVEREVTYGEDQCINLVHISTGLVRFKTTDHVKEIKEALALLILKFSAEHYKQDYLITQQMLKLRDDVLLGCSIE